MGEALRALQGVGEALFEYTRYKAWEGRYARYKAWEGRYARQARPLQGVGEALVLIGLHIRPG